MKLIITSIATILLTQSAQAATSPGTLAFAAISPAGPAFASGNYRAGCQAFGAYQAYKDLANSSNTDVWTLRNLNYGEDSERVVADFCSGPTSTVTREEAASAAESISGHVGLESGR